MPAVPADEWLQRPAVKVNRRFQSDGEQISDEPTLPIRSTSGRFTPISSATQIYLPSDVIPGLVPGIQLPASTGASVLVDHGDKRRDDLVPYGAAAYCAATARTKPDRRASISSSARSTASNTSSVEAWRAL